MSSTQPAASPEQIATSVTSGVSADHPGVNELFALLAYGEVAAFYRLTDEARMAPNLLGRINMASMAAAEMNHYELLRDSLEQSGHRRGCGDDEIRPGAGELSPAHHPKHLAGGVGEDLYR